MATKIDLKETLKPRGPTSQIRLYDVDKAEFEELQRELTMRLGGEQVTTAAVVHYLLKLAKQAK